MFAAPSSSPTIVKASVSITTLLFAPVVVTITVSLLSCVVMLDFAESAVETTFTVAPPALASRFRVSFA